MLNRPSNATPVIRPVASQPIRPRIAGHILDPAQDVGARAGGLRGGNIQAALAQYRPQLLSQMIENQFAKLGTVTGLGQASAAGTGAAAQTAGGTIAALMQQQGQAAAGAALASGQAQAQMWGNVGSSIGQVATLKALKVF